MKNSIKIDDSVKTILLIGANGFLGTNLLQISKDLKKNFKFIAGDIENSNIPQEVPFFQMDITESQDLIKKIINLSPEIIILTGALTNVDQNELDKELATKINTEGPKNVLHACNKINAKLIFMSTDFVFDGISKEGNYNEDDIPNPLSHYGKTKYEAEKAIMNSEVDYLICRTAVLYGWNKTKLNFITWILNNLEHDKKLSIVKNQINNATYVKNLADIIIKLIEKEAKGIYHTAGNAALNRYEMALLCADVFNYDKALITPIEHFKQIAVRPKNAGLDISKLKKKIETKVKILSQREELEKKK